MSKRLLRLVAVEKWKMVGKKRKEGKERKDQNEKRRKHTEK